MHFHILDKTTGYCQSDSTEVDNGHIYPRSDEIIATPLLSDPSPSVCNETITVNIYRVNSGSKKFECLQICLFKFIVQQILIDHAI